MDDLQALKTCLETITVTNGYQTDVAAVAIGRAALAVGSKAALPVITLTSVRDDPAKGGAIEAGLWVQTWTRTVQLEALVTTAENWDAVLDALWNDIRAALTSFQRPLTLSGASFNPPADGGDTAVLIVSASYSYRTNYSK